MAAAAILNFGKMSITSADITSYCKPVGHHTINVDTATCPCTGLPWDPLSTTSLCRPRLRSSFHRTIRSTESNATFRSTKAIQRGFWNSVLLWMIVFKVKIRSIVDCLVWTHFARVYGVPEAGHGPYSAETWQIISMVLIGVICPCSFCSL